MSKLNTSILKSITPPSEGRDVYTDGAGLQLRVTAKNVRSWSLQYTFEGRKKKCTLGKYPSVSLKEARLLAAEKRLGIAKGVDPNAEKKRAAQEAANANRFADAFDAYLTLHVSTLKPKTRDEYERVFKRDILPALGKRPLREIAKTDVIRLLDKTVVRAPVLANRILTYVRAFCNWCVGRGYLDINPTIGIPKPHRERERTKVLTIEEVRALMTASAEVLSAGHAAAFQMLALSCMRRQEVCKMRRDEVLADRVRIGSGRSKNGRSFDVPLTDDLSAILQKRNECPGDFVFSENDGHSPLDFNSRMTKRLSDCSGVKGWHIHDLRRAAATYMEDHGIHRFVVERVLSHADTSTTGIYARSDYFDAKRRALDLWADAVFGRSEKENVILFEAARQGK